MNRRSLVFFAVLLTSLLFVEGASAASCAISQSGSDTGTVMQGEEFIVEVSGLSGTTEAQLLLPDTGFTVDEDKTKTKSSSTIAWTTVKATDVLQSQSISVSLTINNVPQGEISCSPDPFDVVTKPNLDVVSIGSPDPGTLNEGSNFKVNLNIQNTGGTTADLSVSVSGPGMSKVSDTLPDEINPDGNVAGTVTVKAATPGSQTATISTSATNYGNTVDRNVTVDVNEVTEPSGDGGDGVTTGAAVLAPTLPSQAKSLGNITPGVVKKMEINESEKLGVKEISLSVKNKANNVKITVTRQVGKPADVEVNVSGRAYRYMNIEAQNLNESNTEEAKIQFDVNKSWINENNIDPQKVRLNRYADNQWTNLSTSKVSESTDQITYEADTPGFSYFAVSGKEKVEEKEACPYKCCVGMADYKDKTCDEGYKCVDNECVKKEVKECPACPEPTQWSKCVNGTQTRTNYRCSEATNYECESYQEEQSCEVPEEEKKKPKPPIWPVVAGIIVILIIVIMLKTYQKPEVTEESAEVGEMATEEEVDYEEILSGSISEVKEKINELEFPDYELLLETEKQNQNRKGMKEFLEEKMGE